MGIGEMWNDFTDWVAGEERSDDPNPQAVEDTFTQQREGVRNQATDIGFEGEFRPEQILDTDEFEQWDVAALRQRVDQIDIGTVTGLVDAWTKIADRADTALAAFTVDIAKVTDPNVWTGAARDSAVNGIQEYATHGAQLGNSARLTANKLTELSTGLEPTKQLVPYPPEHRSGWDNARGWVVGRGWRNDDVAEYNAKVEAVRILTDVYAPTVTAADTGVPVAPRPHNPVDDGTGPGTPPGNPTGGQPTGGQPGAGEPDAGQPSTEDPAGAPGGENPTGEQPPGTEPAAAPQPTDTGTGSPPPAGTTPAATTPAGTPATTPGAPGPSTGTPGSPPGTPGGAPPGGPGQSVPGAPGSSAGAPAAASGAPGTAARGTPPGMMGGAPGAARGGKSEDDTSKGAPDYLIHQEHGEEVTGLDSLPKTVPPVIGE